MSFLPGLHNIIILFFQAKARENRAASRLQNTQKVRKNPGSIFNLSDYYVTKTCVKAQHCSNIPMTR